MSPSCETVQHAIRDGALTEDQRAHIDGCAACARFELEQRAPAPSASEPALDALFDQLQADVEADSDWRGALRSLPSNRRRALVVGTALVLGVGFGVLSPRPDFAVYPLTRMVVLVTGFVLGTAWLGARAVGTGRAPLAASRATTTALWVSAVWVAVAAALPAAHHDHPAALGGTGASFWPAASQCLASGVLLATPVWLAVILLNRAPGASRRAAWLLGAATAAMAANLALQLHCPIVSVRHLLVGHAAAMPLLLALLWGLDRVASPRV